MPASWGEIAPSCAWFGRSIVTCARSVKGLWRGGRDYRGCYNRDRFQREREWWNGRHARFRI